MGKISLRKRFEVLMRCRFACAYCGARPPDAALEIDHIVALAKGGTNDIVNLTAACRRCNSGKSDCGIPDLPDAVTHARDEAIRWKADALSVKKEKARIRDAVDRVAWLMEDATRNGEIPVQYRNQIRSYITTLPHEDVFQAMQSALASHPRGNSKTFKMFRCLCDQMQRGQVGGGDALLPT